MQSSCHIELPVRLALIYLDHSKSQSQAVTLIALLSSSIYFLFPAGKPHGCLHPLSHPSWGGGGSVCILVLGGESLSMYSRLAWNPLCSQAGLQQPGEKAASFSKLLQLQISRRAWLKAASPPNRACFPEKTKGTHQLFTSSQETQRAKLIVTAWDMLHSLWKAEVMIEQKPWKASRRLIFSKVLNRGMLCA